LTLEERVFFYSGKIRLEGLFNKADIDKGMVICHPHPLFGGNMENQIVEIITAIYRDLKYNTLRFNFRGAGQSEGHYDQGYGEQSDLLSAIEFLKNYGVNNLDLIGYSFGAWVIAQCIDKIPKEIIKNIIWVAPPVRYLPFPEILGDEKIRLIIVGENDDISDPLALKKMVKRWNSEAQFHIIDSTDHFFIGHFKELIDIINDFLNNQ